MSSKRLIIALDFKNFDEMSKFVTRLDPNSCVLKVGLQLFISEGNKVLDFLSSKGFDIFLDLKLHDIPNTVGKAIEEIAQFNVLMTTIHLQGGMEMIAAANQAKGRIKILGVSLLTSLDGSDTKMLYSNDFDKQFNNLIAVAKNTEVDGIVCSSKELVMLSDSPLLKVVPGIRNQNLLDDQKRIMTSSEAYKNGADYIVVGRPITQSNNVRKAVQEYL